VPTVPVVEVEGATLLAAWRMSLRVYSVALATDGEARARFMRFSLVCDRHIWRTLLGKYNELLP
jgi:hypothetical protein